MADFSLIHARQGAWVIQTLDCRKANEDIENLTSAHSLRGQHEEETGPPPCTRIPSPATLSPRTHVRDLLKQSSALSS
jgi:hypothetical protein